MDILGHLEDISGLDYDQVVGDSIDSKVGWENFFKPILANLDEEKCEELYFRYMENR